MDLSSPQHPTITRVENLLEDRNKKKQVVGKDDSSSSDDDYELDVSKSEVSVSQLTGPSQLLTGLTQLEPLIHVPAANTGHQWSNIPLYFATNTFAAAATLPQFDQASVAPSQTTQAASIDDGHKRDDHPRR